MKIYIQNRQLLGLALCLLLCFGAGLVRAQGGLGLVSCIDPRLINPQCVCPAVYDPVCGCNGVTYSNACLARCSGVTRWTDGPCNLCQGPPLNIFCTTQYDPVCGCDGNTYSNACFAMAAGILIYVPGPCPGKQAGAMNEARIYEAPTLAPSPTNGIAVLKWTPAGNGVAHVTVRDRMGKVVATSDPLLEVAGGLNTYAIHSEGWESGIYLVQLSSGATLSTQKLLVTR